MDRKKLVIPLVFILFVCAVYPLFGQNPFISGEAADKQKSSGPALLGGFLQKTTSWQRTLNKRMTELGRDIKKGNNPRAVFIITLLAFIYGVIHALGPGHGKTVSGSYFVSNRAAVKDGVLIGSLIAVVHTVSAVAVVLLLYFILKRSISTSLEHYSRVVKIVSAGAIIAIGIFLLARRLLTKKEKASPETKSETPNGKGLLLIALAVGIVPCPGAILILLFSMNMDIIPYGIVLAFVMSLGMALTISLICCAVIAAKKGIFGLRFGGKYERKDTAKHIGLYTVEIAGAVMVVLLGAVFLAGAV